MKNKYLFTNDWISGLGRAILGRLTKSPPTHADGMFVVSVFNKTNFIKTGQTKSVPIFPRL